jgi:hypothetical protein
MGKGWYSIRTAPTPSLRRSTRATGQYRISSRLSDFHSNSTSVSLSMLNTFPTVSTECSASFTTDTFQIVGQYRAAATHFGMHLER